MAKNSKSGCLHYFLMILYWIYIGWWYRPIRWAIRRIQYKDRIGLGIIVLFMYSFIFAYTTISGLHSIISPTPNAETSSIPTSSESSSLIDESSVIDKSSVEESSAIEDVSDLAQIEEPGLDTEESTVSEPSKESSEVSESSIAVSQEPVVESTPEESTPIESSSELESEPVSESEPSAELQFISVPTSVERNEDAYVQVKGAPNTDYSISVMYKSGLATADGLYTKTSDADGYVSWSWHIGGKTSTTYRPTITVSGGGQKISASFDVK